MGIRVKDAAIILNMPKETISRWCRRDALESKKDEFGHYDIDLDSLARVCVKNRHVGDFTPAELCPRRLLVLRSILIEKILALDPDIFQPVYTTSDIADMTGYTPQAIAALIRDGLLKASKSCQMYRVKESDIIYCAQIYPPFREHIMHRIPSNSKLQEARKRILEVVEYVPDHK